MTGQIGRLLFTDAANPSAGLRAASRNLKKLNEFGLVGSLSRRIGGVRAGSSSLIWHLTHAGERLLRLRDARAFPVRRHFEPSAYFLAHTLAVAETAIKLIEICREHEPEIAALQLEPECWRAYSSSGVSLSLKPDLYAVTTTEEYEDRYFIEVDLDTESPTKIIEKCQRYHAYYRSGLEQEKSEVFPLTVWIVPNITRKEKLIRQLKKAFDKQTKLFSVITCDELDCLILEGGRSGDALLNYNASKKKQMMGIERKTYMTTKRKRGRPMSAHDVSVTPEFRDAPDVERLGRVLLSVAISHAKAKDDEGADVYRREGDAVT